MNTDTQIIPTTCHVYVDEPSEFRHFSRCTDARKQREAERIETDVRERNRKRREARQERRRIARNCKLLFLGAIATCCAISAFMVWRSSYPALSIFPAALSLLALWAGVRHGG